MSSSLNSIADKINSALQNDYKDEDRLGAYVSGAAASQTLTVKKGEKYQLGDRLEISAKNEVMYVLEAPKRIDYLSESSNVAASITAIHAATSSLFMAGCYIKIQNEDLKIGKVSAIGSDNLKVTRGTRGTQAVEIDKTAPIYYYPYILVRRGYAGSTPAYAASNSVVRIVDGWTRYEIVENIKRELESLFPLVSRDFIGQTIGDTNRKQVDDCDTAASWTGGGDAGAAALNTSDEQEGTACLDLSITYSAGSGTYALAPTSFDITGYDYLNLWIYLEKKFDTSDNPYVDNNALEIRIGNDSSNYYSMKIGRDELKEGAWTLISIPIAEMTTTGTITKSAIDYALLTIYGLQDITAGDIKMDEWFLTTYPVTTNKLKYRLPTGVKQIDEIRVLNKEGSPDFTYCRSYQSDEKYLYFANNPEADFGVNKPIVIKGQKAFTTPTSNTATIDVDAETEELLVIGAQIRCIEQKLMEILRSDKLATRYQGTYPLYLDREKRRLSERYYDLRKNLTKSNSSLGDWKNYG